MYPAALYVRALRDLVTRQDHVALHGTLVHK
jgi:hypothetical protein